jgi:enterochelin esterase-like enzyme
MKTRLIIAVALSVTLLAGSFAQQPPAAAAVRPAAAPRAARIISPEIKPDRTVTFRLLAPKATEVNITGEWLAQGETKQLSKNDTGLWTLTVGPLEPELYAYNFNVDGMKVLDPNNVQVRRDGTNYMNFMIIPGGNSDLYFNRNDVPHGNVSKVWYPSSVLGTTRRMYVYTPAGYESGTQKYPVFYLLHGAGGDEDAWTNMGREAQIMDNLIAQGKALPMIVVMTNGNGNQYGAQNEVQNTPAVNAAGGAGMQGGFEEHVVKDVIPFIEKNYRVIADKDHRAIAGLSMGGMHTQTITNNHPTTFSYIGVFSMGIMAGANQSAEAAAQADKERDAKIEALKNSGYKLYWVGVGKDDFVYSTVITLRGILDKHNMKYTYRESTGGHTWANWRIYLSEFAPLLFK